MPEDIIEQERALKISIAAESINATNKGDNYDHQILFDYKEQLKDLHKEMEQKYPLYYQVKYELPVTDLKTI